ncbi:MAG: hypothetical protein EOL91_06810 [Actinobacteria bacterium]|nr:hypothetical protein [Actinomycetota bacterium]
MGNVTLRVIKPRGRFHAVETRDASALDRDGEVFYDANQLDAAGQLWELMFEDEEWIVAVPADLEWFRADAEGMPEWIGRARAANPAETHAVPTDSATEGTITPAEGAAARVREHIARLLSGEAPAPAAAVIDGWADALESITLTVVDEVTLLAQMPTEYRERFGYECANMLSVASGHVAKADDGRYVLTTP